MDLRVSLKYVYGHYLCSLAVQSAEVCYSLSLMVCGVSTCCFISMRGRGLDRVRCSVVRRKIRAHSLFVPSLQHISYTQNVRFGDVSCWHPALVISKLYLITEKKHQINDSCCSSMLRKLCE